MEDAGININTDYQTSMALAVWLLLLEQHGPQQKRLWSATQQRQDEDGSWQKCVCVCEKSAFLIGVAGT